MNRTQQAKAAIARAKEQAKQATPEGMVEIKGAKFDAAGNIVIPATEIVDQKSPMFVGLGETKSKKEKLPPGPSVKHKCGHEQNLKNLENIPCPACRNKAREAHNKAKAIKASDQRLPMEKADEGRLPDGSKFEASYRSTDKRWGGTLTVYLPENRMIEFKDDSGAVMKLLKKLDAQYRKCLAEKSG
jgi:hypothetical protein